MGTLLAVAFRIAETSPSPPKATTARPAAVASAAHRAGSTGPVETRTSASTPSSCRRARTAGSALMARPRSEAGFTMIRGRTRWGG